MLRRKRTREREYLVRVGVTSTCSVWGSGLPKEAMSELRDGGKVRVHRVERSGKL